MQKKISKFKSKPSYDLYKSLWYTLEEYFNTRIDAYIFFQYYKWDIPEIKIFDTITINSNSNYIKILKNILEYDYQVFKVLLFLYWDLEYYLESMDYVKNNLEINSVSNILFKIKYKNKIKDLKVYINKIKMKQSSYFWSNIEIYGLLNQIFKCDFYLKYYHLDNIYMDSIYLNNYKLYKKFNDKIIYSDIDALRVRLYVFKNNKITALYYESYIKDWYKEWKSELNENKSKKYKRKIKELNLGLKNLMKFLKN